MAVTFWFYRSGPNGMCSFERNPSVVACLVVEHRPAAARRMSANHRLPLQHSDPRRETSISCRSTSTRRTTIGSVLLRIRIVQTRTRMTAACHGSRSCFSFNPPSTRRTTRFPYEITYAAFSQAFWSSAEACACLHEDRLIRSPAKEASSRHRNIFCWLLSIVFIHRFAVRLGHDDSFAVFHLLRGHARRQSYIPTAGCHVYRMAARVLVRRPVTRLNRADAPRPARKPQPHVIHDKPCGPSVLRSSIGIMAANVFSHVVVEVLCRCCQQKVAACKNSGSRGEVGRTKVTSN
jgi:hypothetical protein